MGCFWHHHEGCVRAKIPKSNRAFWRRKFARNRARDDAAMKALADLGYRVAVIWECDAAYEDEIEAALMRLIRPLRRSRSAGT
jgi:DNA mismatch endonuclease (patch repair protein)